MNILKALSFPRYKMLFVMLFLASWALLFLHIAAGQFSEAFDMLCTGLVFSFFLWLGIKYKEIAREQ